MSAPRLAASHLLCRALVCSASLLVARGKRSEWLAEWLAELWHVRHLPDAGPGPALSAGDLLRLSLGAFADAHCLRQQTAPSIQPRIEVEGSARASIGGLAAILALSLAWGFLVPNVRAHLRPSHIANATDLILIEGSYRAEHGNVTLPAAQYLAWKTRQQHIFRDFAFYHVQRELLTVSDRGVHSLRVAYTTESITDLLDASATPTPAPSSPLPSIVLSRDLWRSHFGGTAGIVGRTVQFGTGKLLVAAIAPQAASQLPGHPEAWVFTGHQALRPDHDGYILGRLKPSFHEAPWGNEWRMSAPLPDGSDSDFVCRSLADTLRQPCDLFVFAVFLALLALPATTSLPLGEYRSGPRCSSPQARLRRWTYLACKLALVLAVVYTLSLDLTFTHTGSSANASQYLQLVSSFALCLGGLHWALRDQRQRCPVCLGKLSHPARVGHPSRNFLAWNGTELICSGGHGLLHVPALATSWFSTQRWLYLDPSWQVLFPEASLAPSSQF